MRILSIGLVRAIDDSCNNASRSRRPRGLRRYSDLAIETALTLRLLYHLPLRAWGDGRRPQILSVWQRQDVHELLRNNRPLSARRGGHRAGQ